MVMTDQLRRQELHYRLLKLDGVKNAYFQPPEDVKLVYPCVVYKWDTTDIKRADNSIYLQKRGYQLTVIDANPDSDIPQVFLKEFPMAKPDRIYGSDNLYHWSFTLYY